MRATVDIVPFVAQFESFVEHVYICPSGKKTIGFGHTGKGVDEKHITVTRGLELLAGDIKAVENVVMKELPELNENQMNALVSFVFNVGITAFLGSNTFRIIKANYNDPKIAKKLNEWNKGSYWVIEGGEKVKRYKVLPGLIKRRAKEAELYFKPI